MLAISRPPYTPLPTNTLLPGVCACVFAPALAFMPQCVCACVCVRVFVLGNDAAPVCVNLSTSRAETKISSVKQVRQPFGGHAQCLPSVRGRASRACLCSYYHSFFFSFAPTGLEDQLFKSESIRTCHTLKPFWKSRDSDETLCCDIILYLVHYLSAFNIKHTQPHKKWTIVN